MSQQWTAEDSMKMDQAAGEAETELRNRLSTWTPEEIRGAAKFLVWWSKYRMSAGHKRLFKIAGRLLP